jgi:hypothetical protein
MRATLTHDGEPLRPEGASKSAERESAGNVGNVGNAPEKYKQKQTVNALASVTDAK